MSELDYWHPILCSADLPPGRATGVKLAGQALAIFRTREGQLGAVADRCAHRRMKLSLGSVRDGRLICPYHGWAFTAEGEGESPSAPKAQACVTSYACAETADAIWVKGRTGLQELPKIERPGWDFAGAVVQRVRAPLELVIDNFSEIEHTVMAHPDFGFDPGAASRATVEFDVSDDAITVRNRGPAKMPPLETRLPAAIRRGDDFHADYTFRFDPPRSSVTHWWTAPGSGAERMVSYHVVHYFMPEDAAQTRIVTFAFLKIRWPVLRRWGRHFGWLLRRKLRRTVDEDVFILENLADQSPELTGMKLSRFDPVLAMTRERVRRIYYSASPQERPDAAE